MRQLWMTGLIVAGLASQAFGDWVQQYQEGAYPKARNSRYALAIQPDVKADADYKKKVTDKALQDLASQLYAVVESKTETETDISNDDLNDRFSQSLIVVSDIPMYGQEVLKEKYNTREDTYYLLMAIDFERAGPIYKERAEALVAKIDKLTVGNFEMESIAAQEKRFAEALKHYVNYAKHALVAELLTRTKVRSPKLDRFEIEKMLEAGYRRKEEATALIQRLVGEINRLSKQLLSAGLQMQADYISRIEQLYEAYEANVKELGGTKKVPAFSKFALEQQRLSLKKRIETLERERGEHEKALEQLKGAYAGADTYRQKQRVLKKMQSVQQALRKCTAQLGVKAGNGFDIQQFVETERSRLKSSVAGDIDELAHLMISRLNTERLYGDVELLPFGFEDSDTYTAFSKELKFVLPQYLEELKAVSSGKDERYTLSGNYFVGDDTLKTYAMINNAKGETIATSSAKMKIADRKAYVPKVNAYKTMKQVMIDPQLSVQVRMKDRSKNLMFKEGDIVTPELKVSEEACVFAVANMRTSAGKQVQYLLPLNYLSGMQQYEKCISARNANRWIPLNAFEVYPPFGVEAIQVFASSESILHRLPRVRTRNIDGEIYEGVIVDPVGRPMEASRSIRKIRDIKQDAWRGKNLRLAETIIRFSTVAR